MALLPNDQALDLRPRLRVLGNGDLIADVTDANVISNNHYGADRFRVHVASDAVSFWNSQSSILVDVQFSTDAGASFTSLVQGLVDTLEVDPLTGQVRLSGRDLTAALIETRTQEAFVNRTSSEIAQLMAQRHNLSAQITATTTPVGRYYQNEHDRITLDQFSRATTEWDLLVHLAQLEGFDIFVQGTTLHFQPAVSDPSPSRTLTPSDFMDLTLTRSLTLARDIEVVVKSWNSRQKAALTETARSKARGAGGGRAQRYIFVRPNLTADQAKRFAHRKLAELSRHEREIAARMPGDLSLTPRSVIALQGTGTDFDQAYYLDEIERSIRWNGGFTQHIRARNMKPADSLTGAGSVGAD